MSLMYLYYLMYKCDGENREIGCFEGCWPKRNIQYLLYKLNWLWSTASGFTGKRVTCFTHNKASFHNIIIHFCNFTHKVHHDIYVMQISPSPPGHTCWAGEHPAPESSYAAPQLERSCSAHHGTPLPKHCKHTIVSLSIIIIFLDKSKWNVKK